MSENSVRSAPKNYFGSVLDSVRTRMHKASAQRSLLKKLNEHFDTLRENQTNPTSSHPLQQDRNPVLRLEGAWDIERVSRNTYEFERITQWPFPSSLLSIRDLSTEQIEYIDEWIEIQRSRA